MEAGDPLPALRRQAAALLGAGAGDPSRLAKDAHPAASPNGERRDRPADRSPSGSAEGRVRPDRLGPSALPGARRVVEVGGVARSVAFCSRLTTADAHSEPATQASPSGNARRELAAGGRANGYPARRVKRSAQLTAAVRLRSAPTAREACGAAQTIAPQARPAPSVGPSPKPGAS